MTPNEPEHPSFQPPRGEVEIIPPGQSPRGAESRFGFETNSAGRTFSFSSRSGGLLSTVIVTIGILVIFAMMLGTLAVMAAIAVVVFAGFYLRNRIRRWLGR